MYLSTTKVPSRSSSAARLVLARAAPRGMAVAASAAAPARYYLLTASLDHLETALAGSFVRQRKPGRVEGLRPGDRLVLFASRLTYGGGAGDCQRVVAHGTVTAGAVDAFSEGGPCAAAAASAPAAGRGAKRLRPAAAEPYTVWRRPVEWTRLTPQLEIRPLLPRLSFVRDPRKWGFSFMSGWREISAADFAVLSGGA